MHNITTYLANSQCKSQLVVADMSMAASHPLGYNNLSKKE
jgi:hypothetical protein